MWIFGWAIASADACDQELLAQTKKDLESSRASTDVKFRKLVGSLAESCTFTPTLDQMLTSLTGADTPTRPGLERKVVLGELGAWSTACAAGEPAFSAAFAATGAAREAALYGPCDVQRYKFAAPGELAAATGGVPFLSLLVARHFESQQVPDAVAIPLLRALAGLGAQAAAPVATDVWATARTAVDLTATTKFDGLTADQWSAAAQGLLPLCEQLRARPTAERQKSRALEFETCAEAGRAAENSGRQDPPAFRPVGAQLVNWGYYLAAAAAKIDGTLLVNARSEEIKGAVGWYVQQLQAGTLPPPA